MSSQASLTNKSVSGSKTVDAVELLSGIVSSSSLSSMIGRIGSCCCSCVGIGCDDEDADDDLVLSLCSLLFACCVS